MSTKRTIKRTVNCTNITLATDDDGNKFCQNCGIGVIPRFNRPGTYQHYKAPGPTKVCADCDEEQPITDFYMRRGTLDGYANACKECTKGKATENYYRYKKTGYYKSVWVPRDIWDHMRKLCKLRNEQMRTFIIRALKAEVEKRAKEMMDAQTIRSINERKSA